MYWEIRRRRERRFVSELPPPRVNLHGQLNANASFARFTNARTLAHLNVDRFAVRLHQSHQTSLHGPLRRSRPQNAGSLCFFGSASSFPVGHLVCVCVFLFPLTAFLLNLQHSDCCSSSSLQHVVILLERYLQRVKGQIKTQRSSVTSNKAHCCCCTKSLHTSMSVDKRNWK